MTGPPAAVSQLAQAPLRVFGDCLGVVRTADATTQQQMRYNSKYAGVRRSAIRSQGHLHVKEVRNTPAHRSKEAIKMLPDDDQRIALANSHVDELAKNALRLQPPYDEGDEDQIS